MSSLACALALTLTLNSGVGPTNPPATASAETPAPAAPLARWQMDLPERRPAALPILYATFGALQVADGVTTHHALGSGARETNPLMREASRNTGATLAVKALSTAGTIYFTEKAWKKNRKGAVLLMAAINGVTAAIAARNLRNVRAR